jgi:hypothetical protein
MSKYFNYFPKTLYTADEVNADTITQLTSRFNFTEDFKNNSAVSYEYDIQEGDTPEIIADKLYGSSERHWIVLVFNNIIDPQFDWPLDQRTLISFIDEKYSANANVNQSGSNWSKSHTQAYYKVETRTTNSSGSALVNKVQVDANTYANVASSSQSILLPDNNTITVAISKETQSYYDYEIETNESKRTIKLLKPEFAAAAENEFRSVIA